MFRYAREWLWHMVAGFLFADGSGNTISWLVILLLCLEWDVIGTYRWGLAALAWLYCVLCDGCSRTGRNTNLGGCVYLLQVWMWECFPVARPFHHDPQVFMCLTASPPHRYDNIYLHVAYVYMSSIFSLINKCWKFVGYLTAIWDRWGGATVRWRENIERKKVKRKKEKERGWVLSRAE
jgi:hypothetical protein